MILYNYNKQNYKLNNKNVNTTIRSDKRDPRWWQTRWKLHSPPRSKLELQPNYRTINLHIPLNTSWTEPCNQGVHITSGHKNQQIFCPPGRQWSLLEAQMPSYRRSTQNLICGQSPRALVEGRWTRENWSLKRTDRDVWLWGESRRDKGDGPCAESQFHTAHRCHPFWIQHSLPQSKSQRNAINLPSPLPAYSPMPCPVELKSCCEVSWLDPW